MGDRASWSVVKQAWVDTLNRHLMVAVVVEHKCSRVGTSIVVLEERIAVLQERRAMRWEPWANLAAAGTGRHTCCCLLAGRFRAR